MALQGEQPQTIALILAHLSPEKAFEILKSLEGDLQGAVSERIGMMDRISPAVVKRVEETLKKQFVQSTEDKPRSAGGAKMLAQILNQADRDMEKRIFESLEEANMDLVEEIKGLMLVFEDLATLPDTAMQAILREVDLGIMALALRASPKEMKDLVFRNLSQRAAERLQQQLKREIEGRLGIDVHRVTVAADVGPIINLSGAENQVKGSVIDGLSAMLGQRVTFENGRAQELNFHQYPLLRIPRAPVVDVHFIQSDYSPTGLGEPALPPLAPAVGNGIYTATGHRVRTLPLSKEGFSA